MSFAIIAVLELAFGRLYPEPDTHLLGHSLDRYETTCDGTKPAAVTGDRGFDNKAKREELVGREVDNAICPTAPSALKKRMREPRFVGLQQGRSQTEARIAIFKTAFLGAPLQVKRYAYQNLQVPWQVLTHNLWCPARQPRPWAVEAAVIN